MYIKYLQCCAKLEVCWNTPFLGDVCLFLHLAVCALGHEQVVNTDQNGQLVVAGSQLCAE